MYLHGAQQDPLRTSGAHRDRNSNILGRTVGRELKLLEGFRSNEPKQKIKGPKAAEAEQALHIRFLHKQIDQFPERLKEDARTRYLLIQNKRRIDLQEFQCMMLRKFEEILRGELEAQGLNNRKFKIGGYDGGTYERFFKIEPKQYMTRAQYSTALRLAFGEGMIRSSKETEKLFDSFDFKMQDQMDWRSFLYLFTIVMQPFNPLSKHLRFGYAIYSSIGSLDMDCSECVSLGMLKDMICAPVLLSQQSEIRMNFDKTWIKLSTTDYEAMKYAATARTSSKDPDDLKIPHRLFMKILNMQDSPFVKYQSKATSYGLCDSRQWTCFLEEKCYHPLILVQLKHLRREFRNETECDNFLAQAKLRRKRIYYAMWMQQVNRKNMLRMVFIGADIRSMIGNTGYCFDIWKQLTIRTGCIVNIQRVIRGFIARRRRRFISTFKKRVVTVQASSRKLLQRLMYRKKYYRFFWAAVLIQKNIRAWRARRKVAVSLEAYVDTQRRLLQKKKDLWYHERLVVAAIAVQRRVRRWLRMRRTLERMKIAHKVAFTKNAMTKLEEKGRVAQSVFKQELNNWYVARKAAYDYVTVSEENTRDQKKAILTRRSMLEREEKARLRAIAEAKIEKVEEERIERWILRWDFEIERRAEARRRKCNNAILLPETPEDLKLKKLLMKMCKAQVKVVLRRADKMKLPMEIPEAKEIALKEVVDMEVQNDIVRSKAEMRLEAEKEQSDIKRKNAEKHRVEQAYKNRRKKGALVSIQTHMRMFLAARRLRELAYLRYIRHFDREQHEYFYEDRLSHKTSWSKPKSLGSYDIPMAAGGWLKMHQESSGQTYYYNPSSWRMSWEIPSGCVLCDKCYEDFALVKFTADSQCYCNTHFHEAVEKLLQEGWDAHDITFKEFDGACDDAVHTQFYYIPEQTWFMYIYSKDLDPNLKLTVEEEEIEKERMLKKDANKAKKYARMLELQCKACRDAEGDVYCRDCRQNLCYSCSSSLHEDPQSHDMASHVLTQIDKEEYLRLENGGSSRPGSGKHKKGKKNKKDKKMRKKKVKEKGGASSGDETASASSKSSRDSKGSRVSKDKKIKEGKKMRRKKRPGEESGSGAEL